MKRNVILQGDALAGLRTLPDESVDMCMTSPPYWGLRDYGVEGQLGLEPTHEEYIQKLCDVFDEVKRVLKAEGTCWINLGDKHGGSTSRASNSSTAGFGKAKCLMQVAPRFSIEMLNRGWILRNEIIWHKPACTPSSAKDRFTIDFEKIFLFSKSQRYYFKTQYEPLAASSLVRMEYGVRSNRYQYRSQGGLQMEKMAGRFYNVEKGRIRRSVWTISPTRFRQAHFATYPEALCETPIDAGCPEDVCIECGRARKVIWEKTLGIRQSDRVAYKKTKKAGVNCDEVNTAPRTDQIEQVREAGLTDCGCNAGFRPGVVLDPFFGAGTTGLAALKQGKDFIGIELNPEYVKMAVRRLEPFMPITFEE